MNKKWRIHVILIEATEEEDDILEEEEVQGCKIEYDTFEEAMREFNRVRMKEVPNAEAQS